MCREIERRERFAAPWWAFAPLRNALIAAVIAGTVYAMERLWGLPTWPILLGYLFAIGLGAWHWAVEGIEELIKEREIGIEILMLAATAGSGILGMWEEAAALVVLYGAAEGLEEYTYTRTRSAIRTLLDLAPKEAHVLRDGREINVPVESLDVGDWFVVRPGENVPTDGIVRKGRSEVNQAPVTGESVPVLKETGATVFAGSINTEGALTIEATKTFADNTLARIIHLVEEAQEQKGRAQQWIDRFGRRYSPAVLIAAALMLVVPVLFGYSVEFWSHRAVVLLVAAAPCALIMSMPMAMAAGIGRAGRRGILIKGSAHLEHLGHISIVAFDKTGTLTRGHPLVTEVIPLTSNAAELIARAAAVEQFSQHPLARAIVQYAKSQNIEPLPSDQFTSMTGGGASALVTGRRYLVGNPSLMSAAGISTQPFDERIKVLQSQSKTVVVVAAEDRMEGLIALQDAVRPEARAVIAQLHEAGIRTVMLTGDNALAARTVATQLGLDEVRAELKPEGKMAVIAELERKGRTLMVGDGINDAPALAAATCGIAMGAAGSDAAIEAADIALMSDDLKQLPIALALGAKARRISTQNIVFSIAVLVVLIPLAVMGLIGVAFTVLVHESAELLAVANGLRAGRVP